VREKIKNMVFSRYGFENVSQNDIIKEKVKNTAFSRYGVDNILNRPDVREKLKKRILIHFLQYAP
jgi:hypothetical protein